MSSTCQKIVPLLGLLLSITACQRINHEPSTDSTEALNYHVHAITEDPAVAQQRAEEIRKNTAVVIHDGLQVQLWATDSLAPDPIAMSIDDQGRLYLTRTNRQKNSEFDIRGHRDWMTPSISLQDVEDRRKFLHSTFDPEKSKENDWMKDLNKDGSRDWHDLTVEEEEVWRLEDKSGDGMADVSTRVVRDFHNEVTDVAGALLVNDNEMYIGVAPDMWRLTDVDGNGSWDKKESISHGYGVHIGFGGHGMSGAIQGPDGKIYWGIGDIGFNGTSKDGEKFTYPNQGVIVRANPDGSDFEVFAHGLRNTHEFVFDKFGNIISSDNDGDHPGESERLVYIVDGHDAGWRSNWQYGKYTDPKNNTYKVWMDERLFVPRWEGQAAYILPPIVNYHNGPAGMAYNPGAALGSDWLNTFFLVEFVGTPSRSHIWSFKLKPSGASFDLDSERDVLSGILPTAIRFSPDGALYVADWVTGWNTKNYGRVWKLDVTSEQNDLEELRNETGQLMRLDYSGEPVDRLEKLLEFKDMRIRQKAQFELAKREDEGLRALTEAAMNDSVQLARIHGIWGIGQLIRSGHKGEKILISLLQDADPEIVVQAAKVIGDEEVTGAEDDLLPLLKSENARVQFFGAQALGRVHATEAYDPLLAMLKDNNDKDIYLRHAGVLALYRIAKPEQLARLNEDPSHALRLAAVLVLRKFRSPLIRKFLNDPDEYIVAEAARAINDDWSIEEALPDLAGLLDEERFSSEPLMRRAINAALRVGGNREMDLLISYALRTDIQPALKAEALATLSTWDEPSVTDRVDGRFRGEVKRDPQPLKQKLAPHLTQLLSNKDSDILQSVIKMTGRLKFRDHNEELITMARSNPKPEIRAASLKALNELNYPDMEQVIKQGMGDTSEEVRATALSMLADLDITRENLPGIVQPIFERGTLREQQQAISVLKEFDTDKTEQVLSELIARLDRGDLLPGVKLELYEAVDSAHSEDLTRQLAGVREKLKKENDAYQETLFGGDGREGYNYFMNSATGQCSRCHMIYGKGGEVGPDLSTIGNVLTREQLLEAMLEPGARLAPGYGTISLTLKDGSTITGTLMQESEDELVLKTSDAEPLRVPVARITKRQDLPSGMPPMGSIMTKREIRDVIEFLSNLKQG